MSGLNASLGFFLAAVTFGACLRALLHRRQSFSFLLDFSSSLVLVACWLEVQTIVEVGQWAGGLGADVSATILFVLLLSHGVVCGAGSGNPTVALLRFLLLEASAGRTLLAVAAQFLGAHAGLLAAGLYWDLELTDMHTIKNLMWQECSTSLMVSVLQGFFTECVCALIFVLTHLSLRRRSALLHVPLMAVLLTFLSRSAQSFTSAYLNPSLAYGLTFYCSGFTFLQYAAVYWLGPITGMALALLLYQGHIPRLFAKNLFYMQKSRFKVPKAKAGDGKAQKKKT